MEEMPKSKRHSKLQKNKVVENKSNLKECTPIKVISPQGHSTPLDSKDAASTSTEAEYIDVNEDENHSPFLFHCTQDTLAVGWGSGSPQQRSRKKIGSKVKRKLSKENSFTQKKHGLKSCSPVEPLRPRRRFNIEKPASDFSELIPELQVIADRIKEVKDQNGKTIQSGSCYTSSVTAGTKEDAAVNLLAKEGEGCYNDKEEVLASDIQKNEQAQYLNDTPKMKQQQCFVTPPPKLDLLKSNQCDVGSETFTALFDDDEDDCMVKCSQEIEEKLNKTVPVVCSGNSELPLSDYKNNNYVSVESKIRSPKMGKPVRSSPFRSKHVRSGVKKPNSPRVGTKYYIRIKSGTPKYSKDDQCRSQALLNQSSARAQVRYGRTNADSTIVNSKPPTDSQAAFDDSFDAVIQNLSEEDIEMLSQGHIIKKKCSDTETDKQSCQKVEERTQINCKRGNVLKLAVGQSPPMHRPSVNNRPVCEINSNRNLRHVNHGIAANEICAPAVNKTQFRVKVPSRMCNNQSLKEQPSTVSSVELNKHLNKVIPLVNNKVSVMGQGQNNSAAKKNCNVQAGSSTNSSSLPLNAVPKSPQKYTPEEIQKKRLEAKKKLQKKKLALLCENDKLCHHSKGP